MDIPTAPPEQQPPLPDVAALRERLAALNTQQRTLREQILQSEENLSAQERVTQQTQATLEVEAVKKARWEYLQLLSKETGIDLDEMETVIHPIIESCTKDSIGLGKGWIFGKAVNHDNNKLIAHYLSYR